MTGFPRILAFEGRSEAKVWSRLLNSNQLRTDTESPYQDIQCKKGNTTYTLVSATIFSVAMFVTEGGTGIE